MDLSQKLNHYNFPHDIIQAEPNEYAAKFAKPKRTTLLCDQHGIIIRAYFALLGSHFPIETLTPDDLRSLDAVYFRSCADYIFPLLKLLPSEITQIFIYSCGLLAFPDELTRFTELEKLAIKHTRIRSIPEWISYFDKLTYLDISDNILTILPDWMQRLTSLISLDIGFNQFTYLPDWMQKFTNLTSLSIGSNQLSILPNWMQKFTNLTSLDISSNQLKNLPNWMQKLTNLTSLNICSNQLKNLPNWMQKLTNLSSLNLFLSNLKTLPDWMQKLTNLTSLAISSNQLTTLPDWMQELTNLTSLNISFNKLTNLPDWMQKLTNFTSLDINHNQLTNLPDWMQKLTNLTSLDISSNQLTTLPDWMQELTNLTSLGINDQSINLPDWMQKLTNLTSLDINRNQLTNLPDWMQKLTNLTSLDINRNQLTNLPDWMQKLTNLTSLNIGSNQLTSLPDWMQKLTNLTSLDINNNQLTNLPDWIQKLTNLTSFSISNNQLTNLPDWMQKLTNLTFLYIDNNQLTSLPDYFGNLRSLLHLDLSWLNLDIIPKSIVKLALPVSPKFEYEYKKVNIDETTLSQMDISLFEQSHELIEAYYQGEQVQLRECKVIFLGDGEVGKSSLIDRMMFNTFDLNKKSTDGIKINDWQPNGFDGKLRIWDFGGQEIMHSMHNCFLTNGCVYVIVLSGRENTSIDRMALHWLDVVQSFAPGSPVIIAINKSDRKPYASIPIGILREKYPDTIYDYFETSAQEALNIERLTRSITECAERTDGYNHRFEVNMMKVKDSITTMDENYIDSAMYKEICERCGINSPEIQIGLLKWFMVLGVSFYYESKPGKEERPSMEDYKVLKPNWLTNGVYRLINRAEESNGVISHSNINRILNRSYENDVIKDMRYTKKEAEYILFVMRLFRLSYKLESREEDYEFIPVKCKKDMPETAKQYKEGETLHLSWESEFIPYNALYQVMVEMFDYISLENTWRYGSVFITTSSTATVFIEMDIKEERLDVYVKTDSKDAKDILYLYRTQILKTLDRLGIKPDEYLHKTNREGKNGKIKYTTVLNRYKQGQKVYIEYIDDIIEDHDPVELLGIFYPDKYIPKYGVYIKNMKLKGGDFMPENKIEAKVEGNGTINMAAIQEKDVSSATQQTSVGKLPEQPLLRITEQQYAELKRLLNEFTQSIDFKKLNLKNRRNLKDIIKDSSHVSGWEKFRLFINDTVNLTTIATFALTYGSDLSAWIRKVLKC